jgi:FkbM family methyltransferase
MTVGVLDYPKTQIKMAADTELEKVLRLRACHKEPWTTEWIEAMAPGSVLYDVGANVGSYSLLAASRGIEVYAFEPMAANLMRLQQNVALNKYEKLVKSFGIGLGDRDSLQTVPFACFVPGYSSVHSQALSICKQVFQLPILVMRLDNLVKMGLPTPEYIKIDVEEAEPAVLRGAREALTNPAFKGLMVEVDPSGRDAIYAEMKACGLVLKKEHTHRAFSSNGTTASPQPYAEFVPPELKYA